MKRYLTLFLLVFLLIPLFSSKLPAVELKKAKPAVSARGGDLDVSLRLIGGKGSILQSGHDINLTFQTNKDAYVVIYNIDIDGYVHLLFPADGKPTKVKGRKVHFLPEPGKGVYWEAGDKTGIEYIHAFAVKRSDMIKKEELLFLADSRKLPDEKRFRIDMDPFLAFNMIDEEILVDVDINPPASDHTYFYINREVDYPRFLCSKCHGSNNLSDPYAEECPEIVIEKAALDEEPSYPYPELYHVRHTGEEEDEDYYSSTYYAERLTDDWEDDDDWDDDDNSTVYLSIYYSDYDYPYRHYYPYYHSYFAGFYYPFNWDYYWWGFGWSFHWADWYYYHWPFYSWYYPYNYYWAYCNRYERWRHWNDYCCNGSSYRRIHDRSLRKRRLNYASITSRTRRDRAVAGSRLAKRRIDTVSRNRYGRSSLARQVSRRHTGDRISRYRTGKRTTGRTDDIRRRVVHDGRKIRTERRTRNVDRTKDARQPKPGVDKGDRRMLRREDKTQVRRGTKDRERSVDRKSKDRQSSGKTRDRSVKRSRSSKSSGKSSSKGASTRKSSPSRKSSPATKSKTRSKGSSSSGKRYINSRSSSSRTYSSPARSSGRSSSPSRSSSRSTSSRGGSGRARKR